MVFSLVIHHEGSLVAKPELSYNGGSEKVVPDLDEDCWSYIETVAEVKALGYTSDALWWRTCDDAGNIRKFETDKDALAMATYAAKNRVDAHLYVGNLVQQAHTGPSAPSEELEQWTCLCSLLLIQKQV